MKMTFLHTVLWSVVAIMMVLCTASCGDDDNDPVGPDTPAPSISAGSLQVDFGSIQIENERTAGVQIENLGDADLQIDSVLLNNDRGCFEYISSASYTLQAEGSVELIVAFTPSDTGAFNASLQIHSNDPNKPLFSITFTGRGILDHFPEPKNTGLNMSVIINEITGLTVVAGTEIACYTPDSLLAGKESLDPSDSNWGIALWGDDSTTDEVDGFMIDQALRFVVWDQANRREVNPVVTVLQGSGLTYITNGFLVISLSVE